MPERLSDIYKNLELGPIYPIQPVLNDQGQQPDGFKAAKLEYESAYKSNNRNLYSIIYYTVNASEDTNALSLISTAEITDNYNGLAAWNALKTFHSDKSSQSKLLQSAPSLVQHKPPWISKLNSRISLL